MDYEIVDDLVRLVVRAFYSDEQEITVEVLLRDHKAISEEELAMRLKLPRRQIRSALGPLKTDQLVMSAIKKSEDTISEIGEVIPGQKWKQKEYYFIDYKRFIDVVRYRIWAMTKKIEEEPSKGLDNQQYVCPSCKNVRYSALDAHRLLNMETGSLHCERCKSELQEEDSRIRAARVEAKTASLMGQLNKLTAQLKLTEGMTITRYSLADVGKREDASEDSSSNLGGSSSRNSARPVPKIVFSNGTEEEQYNNGPKVTLNEMQTKAPVPWLVKPVADEKQETSATSAPSTTSETFIDDKDVDYYHSFKEKKLDQQVDNVIEEPEIEEMQDEIKVKIGQRIIPISEVTQEDEEKMTPEEQEDYFAKYQIYSGL